MAELKPCDCKKSKKVKGSRICLLGPFKGYKGYFAMCPWCGKETDTFDTKQQAIDAWNKRS